MAILSDLSNSYSLELTPVTPSRDGPRDAYDIIVRAGDRVVFHRQRDFYRRQTGHSLVRSVARAFLHAPQLPGATVGFSVGESGDPEYNEPVCLRVHMEWMHIVLYGIVIDAEARRGLPPNPELQERRIYVDVYLWTNPKHRPGTMLDAFKGLQLCCSPEESVRFGSQLMDELRSAEALRRELGISAPDDYDE